MSSRWKIHVVCAGIGIAAALAPLSASFASGALETLLACRGIAVSSARLACFDKESAVLAAQDASSDTARALNPRQTFGLAPAQIAARAETAANVSKQLDVMTARISSLARAADGREIFTLDNHQVWLQLVPDGELLDAKQGQTVRISRGSLGSYWLRLESRRGCKVTRLR